MGSATIDVVPYNGALAVVDLYTPGQTIVLGDFGPTQSGILTDVDGTLGPSDDGIATFSSQPVTYIGSGTATPGVAVPGPLIIPLGTPVDVVAFEAGGQVYFHYPDGEPDFTGAIAVVIDIDTTPYPIFTPVCFEADSLISTPTGPRPAHSLRSGDMVQDIFGRAHPIRWIGRRVVDLSACDPAARARLAPVLIPRDTLRSARPSRDLRLSQNHLLLIRHPLCSLFHGEPEVLVPAAAMIGAGGQLDLNAGTVTYIHILCDSHVILRANDLAAESFLPGPQALAALTPCQRKALWDLPDGGDRIRSMVAAATVLGLRDARFLLTEIQRFTQQQKSAPKNPKRKQHHEQASRIRDRAKTSVMKPPVGVLRTYGHHRDSTSRDTIGGL